MLYLIISKWMFIILDRSDNCFCIPMITCFEFVHQVTINGPCIILVMFIFVATVPVTCLTNGTGSQPTTCVQIAFIVEVFSIKQVCTNTYLKTKTTKIKSKQQQQQQKKKQNKKQTKKKQKKHEWKYSDLTVRKAASCSFNFCPL